MDKSINIGKVAKMFGISPEALRYYERLNIVVPKHEGEGKYRCYSRLDVTHLFKTRFLQSMGFDLTTIREENSEGMSQEDWLAHVDRRQDALERDIEKAQRTLEILNTYRQSVSELSERVGVYRHMVMPAMLFLNFSDEQEAMNTAPEALAEIKKWADLYPTVRYAFMFTKESLQPGAQRSTGKRGMIMQLEAAQKMNVVCNDYIRFLPEKTCIYTIVPCDLNQKASNTMLGDVMGYIQKQGLSMAGNAYGTWLFTSNENSGIKYYEVLIPIGERLNNE